MEKLEEWALGSAPRKDCLDTATLASHNWEGRHQELASGMNEL